MLVRKKMVARISYCGFLSCGKNGITRYRNISLKTLNARYSVGNRLNATGRMHRERASAL